MVILIVHPKEKLFSEAEMQQNLFHRPPHGKQLHTVSVVPSASVDTSDCTLNGNKMWGFLPKCPL